MPILRSAPSVRPSRTWVIPFVLAAVLAGPAGAGAIQPADYCADAEERAFLDLINAYRAQNGLGPLELSQTLGAAADDHSVEMATNSYFDHTMLGGVTVGDNLRAHGYPDATYGENIAAGPETADGAFAMWQGSASHNANMLRSAYTAVGVGRAHDPTSGYGWYWTTIFGGTVDRPAAACGEAPSVPAAQEAEESAPADATLNPGSDPTAAGDTNAAATADLNLRSGPGSSYARLGTVASGSRLTVTGAAESGYYPVTVDGRFGWVAADFVALDGGAVPAETDPAGESPASLTAPQAATTTDLLNLRAGPSYDDEILRVMPPGAPVTITGAATDGFLPVVYDGTSGWADAAFLDVDEAAAPAASEPAAAPAPQTSAEPLDTATTTADLNLRSGPGADQAVLLVIPNGAPVALTGEASGGYLGVSYNGTTGWADAAYLAL